MYFKSTFFLFVIGIVIFTQPFKCYSQDNIKKRILVIERIEKKDWQKRPTIVEFEKGDRTLVKRFSNDTVKRGKIESVSDSSITIKGTVIKLKDIKSIRRIRGKNGLIVGSSIMGISFLETMYFATLPPKYNSAGDNVNGYKAINGIYGMLGMFVGGGIIVISALDAVSVRHYNINNKWRMYTIQR